MYLAKKTLVVLYILKLVYYMLVTAYIRFGFKDNKTVNTSLIEFKIVIEHNSLTIKAKHMRCLFNKKTDDCNSPLTFLI